MKEFTLVSRGFAWCDHISVQLFLEKKCDKLILHLPSRLNDKKNAFIDDTYGRRLNDWHRVFSSKLNINSIQEIGQAINTEGCRFFYDEYGMKTSSRMMIIESFFMIGFSDSNENEPTKGYTKYTWDRFQHKESNRIHVKLNPVIKKIQGNIPVLRSSNKKRTRKRKIEE